MTRPFTVVALIAGFNEEDIIGEVVRTLVDQGIQVYFLDNHSTDTTVAQIEPYVGRGVIGIETFPSAHTADEPTFVWEQILRRKEQLAQSLDADWFIHSDADEFRESPWNGETLLSGIQRVDAAGYNAIDFQVFNFRPTTADPAIGGGVLDRLLYYEPGEFFDRRQIKSWKKTDVPVELAASGGHSAQFARRNLFPIRFLLRHYPIRSQAHGDRKVFQERISRFTDEERAKGWHVQYDEFRAGTSFVHDPAGLTRYDPEAVRLQLFLRNREVERFEGAASASVDEADRLADEAARLADEAARQADEAARLTSEVERLTGEVTRLVNEACHAVSENAELRDQVAARDRTIAKIMASRSWKLTTPLRAIDRLFRGPGSS